MGVHWDHETARFAVLNFLIDCMKQALVSMIQEAEDEDIRDRLKALLGLIDGGRQEYLIFVNHRRIDENIPDIEVLGGFMLVEVKSKSAEFEAARRKLEEDYCPCYANVRYALVTDGRFYIIYKVEGGRLTKSGQGSPEGVRSRIIEIFTEGLSTYCGLPPTSDKIYEVFSSLEVDLELLKELFEDKKIADSPYFFSYREILHRLYGAESEEEVIDLFLRHTLMSMVTCACLSSAIGEGGSPVEACLGKGLRIELVLPYLRWWEQHLDDERIKQICAKIFYRARLFDWTKGDEDSFRILYELLISRDTRVRMGEYYTPWWLVEYMIEKVRKIKSGLKGKVILDPCCGSGSFLVKAFYGKVEEGEEPLEAIKSIIGFDLNPLAVTVARAELLLAYLKKGERKELPTPLIFSLDSLGALGKEIRQIYVIKELAKIDAGLEERGARMEVTSLLILEERLKEVLARAAEKIDSLSDKDLRKILRDRATEIKNYGDRFAETAKIMEILGEVSRPLYKLIRECGNGVWAVILSSLLAKTSLKGEADIVLSNPPWIQIHGAKLDERYLTSIKSILSDMMSSAGELDGVDLGREDLKQKTFQAGNLAAAFLLAGLRYLRPDGVLSYVMPAEQVYIPGSPHGAGRVLTYAVVRGETAGRYEVVYLDGIDVFGHGVYASILTVAKGFRGFSGKGYRAEAYTLVRDVVRRVSTISRSSHLHAIVSKQAQLSQIPCRQEYVTLVEEECESWEENIKPIIEYLTEESESLVRRLSVVKVAKRGHSIAPLFGGSERERNGRMGLSFKYCSYDPMKEVVILRFTNLVGEVSFQAPFNYYALLIDFPCVRAFTTIPVKTLYVRPKMGSASKMIEEFVGVHILPKLTNDSDKQLVQNMLRKKIKAPSSPTIPANTSSNYVIYRCKRAFLSSALTNSEISYLMTNIKPGLGRPAGIILTDAVGYMETSGEDEAHYYSAALNYLVDKIFHHKRRFIHNQFGRPLVALIEADLTWRDEGWQKKIAELSRSLHEKALDALIKAYDLADVKEPLDLIRRMGYAESDLRIISELEEWGEIVSEFDDNTSKSRIEDAIQQVTE